MLTERNNKNGGKKPLKLQWKIQKLKLILNINEHMETLYGLNFHSLMH